MDVIARLSDCDGRAADAVSAYTRVKMEDDPKLLKLPKSECPDYWMRLPRHKWSKSWSNIEDRVVPFERNICTDNRLLASRGKDTLRKFDWNLDGKKYRIGNVCLFIKQGLFLSENVDDIQMDGKKKKMAPMWKKLTKNVDLDESTSSLGHQNLGCTQCECEPNKKIIERFSKMFEARISFVATEKLPGWMEQLYKVSSPCLDDHH